MSLLIANVSLRVAVRRLSVSGFVALTLLLAACGGGSGGSENSRLDSKSPYTDKPSGGNSSAGSGDSGKDVDNSNDDGSQDSNDDAPQDSGAETPDTNAGTDEPTVNPGTETPVEKPGTDSGEDTPTPDTSVPDAGDDAVVDGGGDAEPDTGVEKPDGGDDSGLLEDVVSEVNGDVLLQWYRPGFRENGDALGDDEIGGYELRYRQLGEEDFQTVIIEDGWDVEYELGNLVGSYQFSIAAYDNNGLYSEFVSLSPVTGLLDSL